MSSAYEMVKSIVEELEDFSDLKKRLRTHAIDIAPDYPDVENVDHWQHVWALSESVYGKKKACEDWREYANNLASFGCGMADLLMCVKKWIEDPHRTKPTEIISHIEQAVSAWGASDMPDGNKASPIAQFGMFKVVKYGKRDLS